MERDDRDPLTLNGRARLAALGVVIVAVVTAAIAISAGWWYYDDFWNLAVARDLGWSARQLTHDVLGHYYPGYNAGFAVIATAGSAGFPVATALIVVGFGAILTATWAVSRRLGAAPLVACAAVSATAIFGGWSSVLLWFSAALNSVPAGLFGLVALGAQLKYTAPDTQRPWRWGVVAGISFLAATSFYEAAIMHVMLIAAIVVLVRTDGGWAHRLATAATTWRWWLPFLPTPVILATAFAVGDYGQGFDPPPSTAYLARFVSRSMLDGYATAIIGLRPGTFDALGSPVVSRVVAALAMALLATALGRRCSLPVTVFVFAAAFGVFALRMTVAGRGRLITLGPDMAHDVRYYTDLAWAMPLLIAAALASPANARRPKTASTNPTCSASRRRIPVFAAAACSVLLVAQFTSVGAQSPQRATRTYYDNLATSADRLRAEGIQFSVLDTLVPAWLLGPQFGSYTHLSQTLPASFDDLRFNDPYLPLYRPDSRGTLRPAGLTPVATADPTQPFPPTSGTTVARRRGRVCYVSAKQTGRIFIPLSGTVDPGFYAIRMTVAPETTARKVATIAAGVKELGYVGFQLPGDFGNDRVLLTTNHMAATQIGFDWEPNTSLCIDSIEVSRLVE